MDENKTNQNKDNGTNRIKKSKKYIPGTKVSAVSVTVTSVLLAVLIALSAFAVGIFSAQPYEVKDGQVDVYELSSKLYTKLIISAMPEKITGNDNGEAVDFYIEENEDYNYRINEPIEQYTVYYYNKDGEKIPLYKGIYYGRSGQMQPLLGFFIKGMENLKIYKKVAIAVLVVVSVAMLALLIYLAVLIVKIVKDKKFYKQYKKE